MEVQDQDPVLFYTHKNWWADNFSAFVVHIWGYLFQTPEHAYHWAKFPDFPWIQGLILNAGSPYEAKKIAEKYKDKRRSDWDMVKVGFMIEIARGKLHGHEYVRRKLMETGTRELIEDSPTDNFWGRGPEGKGENWMGKIWMMLRSELEFRLYNVGWKMEHWRNE